MNSNNSTSRNSTALRRKRRSSATTSSSSGDNNVRTANLRQSGLVVGRFLVLAAVAVSSVLAREVTAFQSSMMVSSTPSSGHRHATAVAASRSFSQSTTSASTTSSSRSKSRSAAVFRDPFSVAAATLAGKTAVGFDISSNLISNLAVVALKMRLKQQTHVSCDVTSKSADLLVGGRVGPVTVKGRGWQSRLGLSCRAIEATVDTCELDLGKILSHRKLRLTKPAEGKAMIALNALDFANFITHPLMKPPPIPSSSSLSKTEKDADAAIQFQKDGTRIDPATGSVTFFAKYQGETWECRLKRGAKAQRRAIIGVRPVSRRPSDEDDDVSMMTTTDVAMQLTESLTQFFNQMVFDLGGTHLSFQDMMVTNQGSSAPSVMLSLSILVHKFPSSKAEF